MIEFVRIFVVILYKLRVLTLNINTMQSDDLSSKKTNNKQNTNEGLSENNSPEDPATGASILKEEIEIDTNGNEKLVKRARNVNGTTASTPAVAENESENRGVSTEKEAMKTVENEDHNSDITANRYPNEHPDNKENRGNIELDEN